MRRLPRRVHALFVFCLLVAALDSAAARNEGRDIIARALLPTDASTTPETSSRPETSSTQPTTQAPTTPTASPTTHTTSSSSVTSSSATTSSASQTTTVPNQTTDKVASTAPGPTNAPSSSISVSTGTDANGQPTVTTVFVSSGPSASSSSSAAPSHTSATSAPSGDTSSGVGVSTIIGLSVAGGIAAIGIISFFIWKFTRKRYSDFDDEPIKWPDLNDHADGYAPPQKTLSVGAGPMDSTLEVNNDASAYYSQTGGTESVADLYAPASDPYAVPPLPHLNPNQPYRDDPVHNGFYDPYRGPVPIPPAFDSASVQSHDPPYVGGAEAIPMNNLSGAVSPQHDMLERAGTLQASMTGRQSPSPGLSYNPPNAFGGRASPAPSPYGGRASPAPGLYSGRASPGPGMIASGRQSPGPGPAYRGGF